MIKKLYSLTILLLCVSSAFAKDKKAAVLPGEEVNMYFSSPQFTLMPADSEFADTIQQAMQDISANIGAELRISIPIPPDISHKEEFRLEVYNSLRTMRSLKGLKYYSSVNKKRETLFTSAYTLRSMDDQKVIKDQLIELPIPSDSSILAVVRASDLSGRVLYRFRYQYKEDELLMTILNENKLYFVMMPLAAPHKSNIKILLRFEEESVDIYMNNGIDNLVLLSGVLAPKEYVAEGFVHRFRAFYQWIKESVTQAIKKHR